MVSVQVDWSDGFLDSLGNGFINELRNFFSDFSIDFVQDDFIWCLASTVAALSTSAAKKISTVASTVSAADVFVSVLVGIGG